MSLNSIERNLAHRGDTVLLVIRNVEPITCIVCIQIPSCKYILQAQATARNGTFLDYDGLVEFMW